MSPAIARRALPLLCLVPFLAAGCGSSSSTAPRFKQSTAQSGSTNACGIRASTISRESAPGPGISLLQTANVSRGDCTDDVRFEFASGDVDLPPRYVAEYQPGPFVDLNQDVPASPGGSAFLVIRFEQTTSTFGGQSTYRGRESVEPGGIHHLRDVRLVRAPDNSVEFVIGLDQQRPFVIDGAPSPPHVTVRIA
jgi:hypothetical protein